MGCRLRIGSPWPWFGRRPALSASTGLGSFFFLGGRGCSSIHQSNEPKGSEPPGGGPSRDSLSRESLAQLRIFQDPFVRLSFPACHVFTTRASHKLVASTRPPGPGTKARSLRRRRQIDPESFRVRARVFAPTVEPQKIGGGGGGRGGSLKMMTFGGSMIICRISGELIGAIPDQ